MKYFDLIYLLLTQIIMDLTEPTYDILLVFLELGAILGLGVGITYPSNLLWLLHWDWFCLYLRFSTPSSSYLCLELYLVYHY